MSNPEKVGGFTHDRDLDSGKEEWLTPLDLIKPLGDFDLDPCCPVPELRPWNTACLHYSIRDDGLKQQWSGRVFCNPPYGPKTGEWMRKCAAHKNATALIFARTETRQFFEHIWPKATSVCFIQGRLCFWELSCSICGKGLSDHCHKSERKQFDHFAEPCNKAVEGGTAGAPSILVTWDDENANTLWDAVQHGRLRGAYVDLRGGRTAP